MPSRSGRFRVVEDASTMPMGTIERHATSFIATSEQPPQHGFFQGYCFAESDYIYGQEGADLYAEGTGKHIAPGLDGCYVVAHRHGDIVRFGADHSGYKALYYFHDGEIWAVSNSVALIADFLTSRKLPVSPNYAHLSAIAGKGSANSQLFSHETVVREIKLLPRATNLVITSTRAALEPLRAHTRVGYEQGLAEHLHAWLSRYETLLTDPRVNLSVDVTGGVDSRTNFALALVATRRLGARGIPPRLNCGSTVSDTRDLDVATNLARTFGLALNDERRFPRFGLSHAESYATYRNLSLGVYYPLYVPVEGPSPSKIAIGGGGGEVHRRFYENHQRSKDPNRFFAAYASHTGDAWLAHEFERDGRAAVRYATNADEDPLRVHYREFRNRFHVGRAPRFGVAFTPLDSTTADVAQSEAGDTRLDEGQFNYDILASLEPALLDMPFDEAAKGPSASIRSRMTAVKIRPDATPGRVWSPDPLVRRVVNHTASRWHELDAALDEALTNPFVRSFWPEAYRSLAKELSTKCVVGTGIGHPLNGKPISAILAADLASPR